MDPLTLSALGTVALTEGIKFLYDQARDLIKTWRERRAAGDTEPIPIADLEAPVLDAPIHSVSVNLAFVDEHQKDIRALRAVLTEYVDEGREIQQGDPELLAVIDALRNLLEVAYGQRITFRGEHRATTGTRIESAVEVAEVSGYVAAVRAQYLPEGGTDIKARLKAGDVHKKGRVVGVDLGSDA